MERKSFIEALRKLADRYESDAELQAPDMMPSFHFYPKKKDTFLRLAGPNPIIKIESFWAKLELPVTDDVHFEFTIDKEAVCRKVKRTQEVDAFEFVPAAEKQLAEV